MTKDQLEEKFEDCFDANTHASEGGYGPDVTSKHGLWKSIQPIISEYAKQQAIAFLKRHIVFTDESMYEKSYSNFVDNQFIEQQNKEQ